MRCFECVGVTMAQNGRSPVPRANPPLKEAPPQATLCNAFSPDKPHHFIYTQQHIPLNDKESVGNKGLRSGLVFVGVLHWMCTGPHLAVFITEGVKSTAGDIRGPPYAGLICIIVQIAPPTKLISTLASSQQRVIMLMTTFDFADSLCWRPYIALPISAT